MDEKILDRAGKVRSGEEIDPVVLADYLSNHILDLKGIPTIKQFKGGASNLTYRLDFDNTSLILRRPPLGTKAKSAHNMGREFDIMKKLKPHYPSVPVTHVYCEDESLIGTDFYVMERIVGMIPRQNLPESLNFTADQVRELCENSLDKWVELHKIDYKKAGFEDYYRGEGYVARQVLGWNKRYRKARTPDVPECETVMAWLEKRMPEDLEPCIIHNDYRFDNMVYDPDEPTKVIGVLDWEMCTVGDPLMDVGSSLAYWIEAKDPFCLRMFRRQPTHMEGMMSRDEMVAYYLEKMGMEGRDMRFYYVFGLFRLAAIIQQIYYRYYHKQTKTKAFAVMGAAVHMMNTYCEKLIKSKSDKLSDYPLSLWDNLNFSSRTLIKKFTA
ncbi:MAG: phosphotransferase family protein [Bacteroidota bacterium]